MSAETKNQLRKIGSLAGLAVILGIGTAVWIRDMRARWNPPPKPAKSGVSEPIEETPEEAIANLGMVRFGKALEAAKIDGKTATIRYNADGASNSQAMLRAAARAFIDLAPKVMAVKGVFRFELVARAEATLPDGRRNRETAIRFKVSVAVADKLDWPAIEPKDLPRLLADEAGWIEVDPTLRKAWASVLKEP